MAVVEIEIDQDFIPVLITHKFYEDLIKLKVLLLSQGKNMLFP